MALNETACYGGEFLLSEANGSISREEVTIAAAAGVLEAGTVLGKLANGKYVAYSNAANDGSEVAAGVVYHKIPDLAVDQKAVIIARHAEVIESKLTGIDAAGKADLAALQIFCR